MSNQPSPQTSELEAPDGFAQVIELLSESAAKNRGRTLGAQQVQDLFMGFVLMANAQGAGLEAIEKLEKLKAEKKGKKFWTPN